MEKFRFPWLNETNLSGLPVITERDIHPHHSWERAELFHSFDAGSTEIEFLNLIHALIIATKPLRCLETGTFLGMGAICIAHALRENGTGHLTTLEKDPQLCDKARAALQQSGMSDLVSVICTDSLSFIDNLDDPIDFAFIDSHPSIRHKELSKLINNGILNGLAVCHDTSRLRVKFPIFESRVDIENYMNTLDSLTKHPFVRGTLEFNISRGVRIFQVVSPFMSG